MKDKGILFHSSACEYPVFPAAFVEEAVFSLSHVFGTFVKNQLVIDVWVMSGSSMLIH
jgi:hypothetical protein